jgi:hypothetical protein
MLFRSLRIRFNAGLLWTWKRHYEFRNKQDISWSTDTKCSALWSYMILKLFDSWSCKSTFEVYVRPDSPIRWFRQTDVEAEAPSNWTSQISFSRSSWRMKYSPINNYSFTMSVGASKLMTLYWRPLSRKLSSWELIPRWRMAFGHRVPYIFRTYQCRFKTDLNMKLLFLFFVFTTIFVFLNLFLLLSVVSFSLSFFHFILNLHLLFYLPSLPSSYRCSFVITLSSFLLSFFTV